MSSMFERSHNASFVTLILKTQREASNIRDFGPVSVVGSFYKILARMLAHRLRGIVSNLLSNSQNAFVKGRY